MNSRGSVTPGSAVSATAADNPEQVHYRATEVQGVSVFYREAGRPEAPSVLLLHGFAASSYMFRELIPVLARDYHVIAPDLPGFGQTIVMPEVEFNYTFDNLTPVIDAFTVAKGVDRYGSRGLSARIRGNRSHRRGGADGPAARLRPEH